MRKFLKNSLLDIFKTLYEAHDSVRELVKKAEYHKAVSVLGDCQDTAVKIGGYIEDSEGEDCPLINLLLKYCEELYHVSETLTEVSSVKQLKKRMDKALFSAEDYLKREIKVKLEVVFLPYKASMWDSLESVWRAADSDPECNAYVVPIPYYDRNPDHSLGKCHYEGKEYPEYVPIVDYNKYNIELHRPDIVFIHNPFDDYNYVTSIDPLYYSHKIKKYTDQLVYIPYYVPDDYQDDKQVATPVCQIADKIIINSNRFFELYKKQFGGVRDFEKRFLVLGSPKVDALINAQKTDYTLPDDWYEIIKDKKVVLYTNTLSQLLKYGERYLAKLSKTFEYFNKNKNSILWWRPHPLTIATLQSMRPQLLDKYLEIKNMYISNKIGLYDDSPLLYRAIVYSDICYSDERTSIHQLYCMTGKPIITAKIEAEGELTGFNEDSNTHYEDNSDLSVLKSYANHDGTAGKHIYEVAKSSAFVVDK